MSEEEQQRHGNILVVDDNQSIRELLEYSLGRAGYEIDLACNGREALDYIFSEHHEHPDLIVLDLMMPEIGGLEVLRRLKGNDKTAHIPILVLSVKDSVVDTMTGIEIGADYYWTKPFKVTELLRAIDLILEVHKGSPQGA